MLLQDGGRCSYGVMLVRCLLGTFACGLKSSACNVVLRVGLALIVFRVPFLLAALVALHPFERVLHIRHAQVCYGKVVRVAIQ